MRLYVKFHEEAEKHPELEDEAPAAFAKLEQKDPEAVQLWKWFVEISYRQFNRIYDLLGVRFDSDAGESFYIDKTPAVVEELKAKGLLTEDDGALIVRLDEYDMAPVIDPQERRRDAVPHPGHRRRHLPEKDLQF